MIHTGKLKSWNSAKGFGFIAPKYGGKDIFVHISDFVDSVNPPAIGQDLTFTLATDNKGRACGKKVYRTGERQKPKSVHAGGNLTILMAILFIALVSYSALSQHTPMLLVWIFLAINCCTFILYAADKGAARQGRWRTRESTLHLASLFGGWPAAAFAQQIFRHKSKKIEFRLVYWLTIAVNIAGYYWLHTTEGQILLERLIAMSVRQL